MLLSLVYVLMPADLVPDLVPIVGWLDDAGVVSAALAWLWASLRRYEEAALSASAAGQLEADPARRSEPAPKASVRLSGAEARPDPPRAAEQ